MNAKPQRFPHAEDGIDPVSDFFYSLSLNFLYHQSMPVEEYPVS
jgi:hypothetical protein